MRVVVLFWPIQYSSDRTQHYKIWSQRVSSCYRAPRANAHYSVYYQSKCYFCFCVFHQFVMHFLFFFFFIFLLFSSLRLNIEWVIFKQEYVERKNLTSLYFCVNTRLTYTIWYSIYRLLSHTQILKLCGAKRETDTHQPHYTRLKYVRICSRSISLVLCLSFRRWSAHTDAALVFRLVYIIWLLRRWHTTSITQWLQMRFSCIFESVEY